MIEIVKVVLENVSLVVSRIVLTEVATALTKLSDEVSKDVAHYTLEKVCKLNTNKTLKSINWI